MLHLMEKIVLKLYVILCKIQGGKVGHRVGRWRKMCFQSFLQGLYHFRLWKLTLRLSMMVCITLNTHIFTFRFLLITSVLIVNLKSFEAHEWSIFISSFEHCSCLLVWDRAGDCLQILLLILNSSELCNFYSPWNLQGKTEIN